MTRIHVTAHTRGHTFQDAAVTREKVMSIAEIEKNHKLFEQQRKNKIPQDTTNYTAAMKRRIEKLGGKWTKHPDGYYTLLVKGPYSKLAYVALPPNHPDIGYQENTLDPDVNGGLTFGDDNVFGWDYGHYQNRTNPQADIKNALKYFREREKKMSSM